MPHVVLIGEVDLERLMESLPRAAVRWRAAVLKTDQLWLRADRRALLVEGVVVEHARPLKPVAVIAPHEGATSVRLWSRSAVERTPAVQRWLALLADGALRAGCERVRGTNLAPEAVDGLGLTP